MDRADRVVRCPWYRVKGGGVDSARLHVRYRDDTEMSKLPPSCVILQFSPRAIERTSQCYEGGDDPTGIVFLEWTQVCDLALLLNAALKDWETQACVPVVLKESCPRPD